MTDLADELTDADMLLMWQSGPHRDRSTAAGWFPNPLAGAAPQEADSPFDPPADPAPRADDDAQPLAVLEGRITSMAARLAAETREWLVLVAEFNRRKGWAGWGMRSMAHWLSYSCSVTPGVAREYVRVATPWTGWTRGPCWSRGWCIRRRSWRRWSAGTGRPSGRTGIRPSGAGRGGSSTRTGCWCCPPG